MTVILCTRFPDKTLEFWAYQATIVRVEQSFDGSRWVMYDRQFCMKALARKDLNWSNIDCRLYNEVFQLPVLMGPPIPLMDALNMGHASQMRSAGDSIMAIVSGSIVDTDMPAQSTRTATQH